MGHFLPFISATKEKEFTNQWYGNRIVQERVFRILYLTNISYKTSTYEKSNTDILKDQEFEYKRILSFLKNVFKKTCGLKEHYEIDLEFWITSFRT